MTSNFFKVLNEITGNPPSENCQKSVLERVYNELIETPDTHLLTRALLIVNLIELLSQYQSGKLHKKGNHKRFDRFLQTHTNLSSETNHLLYTFRNALVHNGGSYASDQKGNVYRFILIREGVLLKPVSKVIHEVNVEYLQQILEKILTSLSIKLSENKGLRSRFKSVHERIGFTVY
jgi:hypothetical protein